MKAAIYARQSLDREKIENETKAQRSQRQSEAIDRQVVACRKLIQDRGWEALEPYTDNDVSASKSRAKNTAWSRMLVDIAEGKIDVVVSVDLDRLLRSTSDLVTLLTTGVKAMTIDGEIDLTTADGEFRATMLTGIARFEVRRKAERQRRANAHRIASGKPLPSRRRYGYETDGLTPRKDEAAQVVAMFEDFDKGASVRSLSIRMGWRTGRVRETLSNPSYWGYLRSKGETYEAPGLEALVPEDLAKRVQERLNDPTRRTTPGPEPKHLASGIAVCGVCGSTMFYMRDYRCRKDSSHPSIQKKILDPLIASHVADTIVMAPLAQFAKGESTTSMYTALNACLAAQERFLDMMERGVTVKAAEKRLVALEAEENRLRELIDTSRARSGTARILADMKGKLWHGPTTSITEAAEAATSIADAYLNADLEAQRELLRAMYTVKVNPGRDANKRVVFEPKNTEED